MQKGELGKCLADTYPLWFLLIPFPLPAGVLQWGRQCRVLRVPREVWQGRWAFSCAGWASIPEQAAIYGCAWHEVLGLGLVFAAGRKRKCFGIFVLFLMCFSYWIWEDLEKLIWNLWGFFLSKKSPGIKDSLGLSCWHTQAPADEGDEVGLLNWVFLY